MNDDLGADDDRDNAERIFAEHLLDRGDGVPPDIDAVIQAHSEHADALRAIGDAWHQMQAALKAEVEVAASPRTGGAPANAWARFLDQLRGRGPGHTRYVFRGEIARGGMGVIQHVYDQDTHRDLAMKVILGQADAQTTDHTPAVDERVLGRFLEEAQVTSQLDHPGVVPVHEIGVDAADRVYFTMKLVKGEDLRAVFERVHDPSDDAWSTTRALGVLLRVCEAMSYAHDKGVIHRDLKPANIMVGSFGEAYVMDWGLARVLDQVDRKDLRIQPGGGAALHSERRTAAGDTPDGALFTMDGDVVGTPAYMPPEQAEGRIEDLGSPADVYAMGAMMYHLLAGHMPYAPRGSRRSSRAILADVTRAPPASIARVARNAPPEVIAICEKAMARRVADRYPDMAALARDLRSFLEGRVVSAYESGAWAELKKWIARNRALAATAAAALAAVLILSGWAVVERARAKDEAGRADENAEEARRRAGEAEAARAQADREKRVAEDERDRVLRLSDKRRLDVLVAEADRLWPAHPDNVSALREWLARARRLLGNLEEHEASLAVVRANGTPQPDPREEALTALQEHLARHAAGEELVEEVFEDDAARATHVEARAREVTELSATIELERGYDFGDDEDARWWHDAVRDLVLGLHGLHAEDVHAPTMAAIEARLAWAESVAEQTITGTVAAGRWAAARASILQHTAYGGLDLTPQVGLIPLGQDPDSTLWEFAHPQTGAVPDRSLDSGVLAITEETGLVFVLIPGGAYRIGAQRQDPDAPHHDAEADSDESPVFEVTLWPYFMSKYEMTQGQWMRLTGENPSYYRPDSAWSQVIKTLHHPVEQVSWSMCSETLGQLGMELPTDAQWEAACRARTGTPWWTGLDRESLEGAANLADQAAKRVGASWPDIADWPQLDDGYPAHAPIGAFRANPFGVHDIHGNVWEWCRDRYQSSGYRNRAPIDGDGLRDVPGAAFRALRGGGFDSRAALVRASNRHESAPEFRNGNLGLRPARRVE